MDLADAKYVKTTPWYILLFSQPQNDAVEQLQRKYEEKLTLGEQKIAELQLALERLQLDKPDVAKLMAEIESGKVGAARAVAQNMELKAQLEEMQKAFVQIVSSMVIKSTNDYIYEKIYFRATTS